MSVLGPQWDRHWQCPCGDTEGKLGGQAAKQPTGGPRRPSLQAHDGRCSMFAELISVSRLLNPLASGARAGAEAQELPGGAGGARSRVPGEGRGLCAPSSVWKPVPGRPLLLPWLPKAARPGPPFPGHRACSGPAADPTAADASRGFAVTSPRPCNPITGAGFQDRPILRLLAETFWKLQALASEAPALRGSLPVSNGAGPGEAQQNSFTLSVLGVPLQLRPQIVTPALSPVNTGFLLCPVHYPPLSLQSRGSAPLLCGQALS